MKNIIIIFSAALTLMVSTAKAQIQQGNFLVGADIAHFKLSLNEGGLFDISLSPKLAFFFRNNVALGAYIDFSLLTAKDAGSNIDYGIGGLGRYYFSAADVEVIKHSRLFFEGTVGINGTNPASGENTNGLGLSIGPGLAYFITPNIGLEGLVKYANIVGFGNRVTSSDVLVAFGLQVYLGPQTVKSRLPQKQE